jgi:peroxiredoxin
MKTLFFGLLMTPFLAAAQLPKPYLIKGQANTSIGAPAKVYLYYQGKYIDSAAVNKGGFVLRGVVAHPGRAFILLSRTGNSRETAGMGILHADVRTGFYLEPGTTTLSSPDSLKHSHLVGGKLTTQLEMLNKAEASIVAGYKQYDADYKQSPPEQRSSPEFKQARALRRAALNRQRTAIDSAFIVANPASVVSLDALDMMSNTKADTATAHYLLTHLTPALRNGDAGQKVAGKLAAFRRLKLTVGATAPNFTLMTANGLPVSLASYRGRYVLIDFWASWCGPCRKESPNVLQAYEHLKDKNFEVLSVSIDAPDNRSNWLKAVHDDQLPWTQVIDVLGVGSVAKLYQVESIPQNFLINTAGVIVAKDLRGNALHSVLAKELKQ